MMSSSIDLESIKKFVIQFQRRCMLDPINFEPIAHLFQELIRTVC